MMTTYSLGADTAETLRLDAQARSLHEPTVHLLRAAGIGDGMRVLDLGTGLGHVARIAADLVGPSGEVVGVDNQPHLLEIAARRAEDTPWARFVEGDVRSYVDERPFDAVVGRLILFHLPDREAVLRHHLKALRPGGLAVALDYDLGAARSEPPIPLAAQALALMIAGFRSAGADPMIGARLGPLLTSVGLSQVRTFGIQPYDPPTQATAPQMVAAVLRSLQPQLAAAGLGLPDELDPDTLAERLTELTRSLDATWLMPTLAGAWGAQPIPSR